MQERLKQGDWIRCAAENDMRKLFKALNKEGYNAVRLSANSFVVMITGTPESCAGAKGKA